MIFTQSCMSRGRALRQVDSESAKSILKSVNWDFSTPFSVGRSGLDLFDARKYHWYPATFIPEIPHTLLEVLSRPEAKVFDPFMGIGTTIYQALDLGRTPYGNEICRVSFQSICSFWTLLSPKTNIEAIRVKLEEAFSTFSPTKRYEQSLRGTVVRADVLSEWYHPRTFRELCFLILLEKESNNPSVRAAMRIAISAALKAVCAQDKGWGCIADNVLPKENQLLIYRDSISRVRQVVFALLRGVETLRNRLPESTKLMLAESDAKRFLIHKDIRDGSLAPDREVDLIITSPPYPSMTDYVTSQRLSYYWLGSDPSDDLPSEIGARRRRFSAEALPEYNKAMRAAIDVMKTKLRRGGYLCFVLPRFNVDKQNNIARREAIRGILDYVEEIGITPVQELERILPERRRHHNQGWTSLEREMISIFRRNR